MSHLNRALQLALLLSVLTVQPASLAGTPGEVAIGGILGEATLQGLNGPVQHLSALRGRPLIINVWASWCGPCRAEMASLERLAWRTSGRGFNIIGISTDDYVDRAKRFLGGNHTTISHYIDQHQQLENMLGASRLPLTVLVDADGRVLEKIYGAHEWDSAESQRLIDKTFQHSR